MQSFFYRTLLASTALCCLPCIPVQAAPAGGTVSAGSAIIGQTANITTVTQSTNRAAIDWNSFNIGAGERVDFKQPSTSAITLNRIHDQNPSQILGSITANGTVILSNPSGMVFSKNSKVDVGSLIATTADISNDAFLQDGPLKLTIPGHADAKIIANGSITAKDAGLVAILAPNVENNGIITAKLGKAQLAGAETATLDLYGDGLVSIAVTDAAKETSITHTGTIAASYVALTATDAASLVDSTVNVDGIIDASDARIENGALTFGGKIEVTARNVTLETDARLRATGKDGGGIVKVGGGWQGKGTIRNAKNTTVKTGARINASATDNGNGGIVAVWSDETTQFDGTILAKGGPNDGNGGHIETSGKINLGLTGSADASSAWGTVGEWLLDPRNVTIQNNAQPGAENNVPGTGGVVNAPSDSYRISAESIGVALSAGNNVTITTGTTGTTQSGVITLGTADITSTSATDVTLTLKADSYINSTGNNTITATGTGKLHTVFWADAGLHDTTEGGAVSLVNTNITTNGGDFYVGGGADDGFDITDTAGNVLNDGAANDGRPDHFALGTSALVSGVRINNSDITTGAGSVTILGQGATTSSASLMGIRMEGGSSIQSTSGNMKLIGFGGTGTSTNRGVSLDGAGTELATTSGAITVYGKGGTSTSNGDRGVVMATGAKISSAGTGVVGDIRITGVGGTDLNTQSGIYLTNANTEISTVDADIILHGTGGTGTNGGNVLGIGVIQGAKITSAGTGASAGKISLTGIAGTSTTGSNQGVHLNDQDTAITSIDGDIYIEGRGGNAPGANNFGIIVTDQVVVESLGTTANAAKIEMKGYGGSGTNSAVGLRVEDYAVVRSGYGDITMEGTGGTGTEDRARGVLFNLYAGVESTGTGPTAANITIKGTGGSSLDNDHGVVIAVAGFIHSVDGDIDITGKGGTGSGASNYGFYMLSDATSVADVPAEVWTTGDGNIAINATSNGIAPAFSSMGDLTNYLGKNTSTGNITINTNTMSNNLVTVQTTGVVTVAPTSTSTDIGVAGAPGTLQLTEAFLNSIDAGSLVIGRADSSGFININQHMWDAPVEFKTGPNGLINLMGSQTGAPGTNASITFSGPARTFYDIDFTGTTGTGVTFNSSRDVKTGGGSGSLNTGSTPVPSDPGVPAPPSPGIPGTPDTPQLPPVYIMNQAILSAVIAQEDIEHRQMYNAANLGNFDAYLQRHVDLPLYSLDPELEKKLGLKN
ncbi:MAG: filamentous hemagglutinin N-terminal domain-containing protein [Rickettsiales bacterium]